MSASDHIKQHVVGYLIGGAFAAVGLILTLAWQGFEYRQDQRHEMKGASQRIELRQIKRELRRMENYQRLAPNSAYHEAREAEIAALEDEVDEIEKELSE